MTDYNQGSKLSREDELHETDEVESDVPKTVAKTTTTTSTIMTTQKRKNKRNLIIFLTLLGLNIVLVILIIWQIASIFSS